MVKVQLPRVEEETRAELNIIKAQRKDKSLGDTLQGLIEDSKELVEAKKKNAELEAEVKELKEKVFELSSDLTNIKMGRSTLTEFRENMKHNDGKGFTVQLKGELSEVVEYNEEEELEEKKELKS